MNVFSRQKNNRVLIVDDNAAIHEDFEKILCPVKTDPGLADAAAAIFGGEARSATDSGFELGHASHGREGLECVQKAQDAGAPFAVAFVDVRMPPGWDGIETAANIWKVDPAMQIVICTAHSDYSWEGIRARLDQPDNLLILKKPFDNIEVLQLAHALTAKWSVTRAANARIDQLDRAVITRTQDLKQSEERFAKAFGNNPLAMFIQEIDSELILNANHAFLKLFARRTDEVLGRTPCQLGLWSADRGKLADLLKKTLLDPHTPVPMKSGDGEERKVFVSSERFEVSGVPCCLVLLDDVTERVRLEADLLQAHKMEALGQLATGVAHDFNNLLTVIQGQLSLVLSGPLDASTNRSLTSAFTASQRAGNLTRQLLAFSRKQVMERKSLSLASVFEQVEAMLARLIGDQVEIQIGRLDNVPPVLADRGNLEQVLINLAVNARDAMPRGGKLTMTAAPVLGVLSRGTNPTRGGEGDFICISVSDTGSGMTDTVKARIFDPFFTTKERGKGTGMGLATVHGIVKQHQGWIEVDTALGTGTTFRVYLPIGERTAGSAPPIPAATPLKKVCHETILVAEDEPAVMDLVESVLSAQGYRVLKASSGADALKVWAREAATISLLFTDMVMPGGMNGKELADRLKQDNPKLRVVYSTGYSAELIGADFLARGDFLLRKPYSAAALMETVRTLLDAPQGRPGKGA